MQIASAAKATRIVLSFMLQLPDLRALHART